MHHEKHHGKRHKKYKSLRACNNVGFVRRGKRHGMSYVYGDVKE